MRRSEPIPVGTQFLAPNGIRWVVYMDRCFGRVMLVSSDRKKSMDSRKSDLRHCCDSQGWTRLPDRASSGFLNNSEATA